MSILPVLGHKPITSYFSRTSSAKRKWRESDKAGTLTGGISKRPKQSPSSSFPSKEVIGDGLKATNRANGSDHSREKVDSPCTPLANHSWKQNLNATLPTPPLTCKASRPCKGPEIEPSSSPQTLEAARCQGDESGDTLPSLSSASYAVVSNVNVTPSITIPSSQSQDSHPGMEIEVFTSFSKISGNSSTLGPTGGGGMIIESSQSQLLIMSSPNARKLGLKPTLPAFNVVIPSSQSQEEELIIPTKRGRHPVGTTQRGLEIPQRTLSEELFPFPIQDSILDNLFLDEEALDAPARNSPNSSNPTSLVDSETEDEHEGLHNPFNKERSLERTAARASSDSQSSPGIGSYSPLPPEVSEFRKMFENGDESYPADFPESLRS